MEQNHNFTPLPPSPVPAQPQAEPIKTPLSTPNNVNHGKALLLVFLTILLFVMAFVTIFSGNFNSNKKRPALPEAARPTVTPTIIPYPTLGVMYLSTKDSQKRYPVNSTVTVILNASSEDKNIVSFDGIVSYDANGFTYSKASSSVSGFTVYPFDRKSYVSLSGVKTLQDEAVTALRNTPVASIEFQAAKKGTFFFSLDPVGKETSKLVDDKGQVMYPKSAKLELEIY